MCNGSLWTEVPSVWYTTAMDILTMLKYITCVGLAFFGLGILAYWLIAVTVINDSELQDQSGRGDG